MERSLKCSFFFVVLTLSKEPERPLASACMVHAQNTHIRSHPRHIPNIMYTHLYLHWHKWSLPDPAKANTANLCVKLFVSCGWRERCSGRSTASTRVINVIRYKCGPAGLSRYAAQGRSTKRHSGLTRKCQTWSWECRVLISNRSSCATLFFRSTMLWNW